MVRARLASSAVLLATLLTSCGAPNEDRLNEYVGDWKFDPKEVERVRIANDEIARKQEEEARARRERETPSERKFHEDLKRIVDTALAKAKREQDSEDAKRDRRDRECFVLRSDGTARLPGSPTSWEARWYFEAESIRIVGEIAPIHQPFSLQVSRRGETLHIDDFGWGPKGNGGFDAARTLIRDE